MITLYFAPRTRSVRILWLLEELGVPYEIKHYKRNGKTNLAPPELKAVHPLGKSPVIEDNGKVFAETGAMIEHILDAHGGGRLRPAAGTPAYDQYRYWLHAAEGSYMPSLVLTLFVNRIETASMPFFAKPIAKKIAASIREGYLNQTMKAQYDFLEAALSDAPWLAGDDITAADIIMSFPVEAFTARAGSGDYPNIEAYRMRFQSRPAYARALERGGPYALLG